METAISFLKILNKVNWKGVAVSDTLCMTVSIFLDLISTLQPGFQYVIPQEK